MKKTLLFVHNSVGGAERMTVLIGKSLPLAEFNVFFYIVNIGNSRSSIVDFIPNKYKKINIPECSPLLLIKKIFYILKKEKPDIVFSSALLINDKILPLRYLFPKTRFIIRCENYLFTFSKKQRLLIALMYRMADTIIVQTQEMKDELVTKCRIKPSNLITLENPLDTDRITEGLVEEWNPYQNTGKKVIVASGRICYQKGFDLLIKAFAKVCKERDDVLLYIIGDYSDKEEYAKLIELANNLGILNCIKFMGFQNNPYPFVKYADCFALSSRWEGLPNVLIESLYLGTPVAAMKCVPIIERIIIEGVNGYTSQKDDIDGFADVILKTLKLGRVASTYTGATKDEFTNLFK